MIYTIEILKKSAVEKSIEVEMDADPTKQQVLDRLKEIGFEIEPSVHAVDYYPAKKQVIDTSSLFDAPYWIKDDGRHGINNRLGTPKIFYPEELLVDFGNYLLWEFRDLLLADPNISNRVATQHALSKWKQRNSRAGLHVSEVPHTDGSLS